MDRDLRAQSWIFEGGYYALIGAMLLPGFAAIALLAGFPVPLPGHPILLLFLALVIGLLGGRAIGKWVFHSSERAARSVYMPSGASTPYTTQFSQIDTLEARGDVRGAVDAWEALAVAEPHNPWPLIRSGELYLRKLSDPAMALERFKLARKIPSITVEHQIYATQKIVDLYLGPLHEPGRALVELRRLVETFPDRREAQFAREALARLKSGPEADPFNPG